MISPHFEVGRTYTAFSLIYPRQYVIVLSHLGEVYFESEMIIGLFSRFGIMSLYLDPLVWKVVEP